MTSPAPNPNQPHHHPMKPLALAILCLAAASPPALAAGKLTHPDTSRPGWRPLFNQTLSNARKPEGVWTVEDGVLTASKDEAIWSEQEFANAVIDLEFKTAEGTNSGVIVYASNTAEWIPNSIEVQIADDHSKQWSSQPATWQCAAIFGHLAASRRVVRKPGEWNRMTVFCKGPQIDVVLNGEHVTSLDMRKWTSAKTNPDGTEIPSWLSRPLAELPTKGRIGLQGKHAGAPIWFRNVKVLTP